MQGITDMREGIPLVIDCIKKSLRAYTPKHELFAENPDYSDFTGVLYEVLLNYCEISDKPLVLFFDESDCLSESTLISFLRQLRAGYTIRTVVPFVHSVALVGMRNIRDYKAKIRPDSESLGSASPFNIVTETFTLKNFTKEEIASLYQQHTDDTGQIFEAEAIDFIFEQTQGQPWLVNAVVKEIIEKMLYFDYSIAITAEMAKTAIQTIILRRDTHIDSLLERLKEERVRNVIEPMICGESVSASPLSDDFQYTTDLGLVKYVDSKVQPSNPIYGEVIIRTLSQHAQQDLTIEKPNLTLSRYLKGGKLDISLLLTDFQQFWRENSDIWKGKVLYVEAAPQLILQAFLQRVLNGGGDIKREMAAGTGRLDLGVVYGGYIYPIEIKLWRGDQYYQKGLDQIARYADTFGCKEAWLLSYNKSVNKTWDEKIYRKEEVVNGIEITVFGI
jgi:hypothetical protein